MSDAYGFLAPIYQSLSRLVFGQDLLNANRVFMDLGRGKRSLIIGGGDGLAYRDWDRSFVGEYWDTSPAMAKIAKRNLGKSGIEVNCGSWPDKGEFDVVFLPFVLDTLPDPDIIELVHHIQKSLHPGGLIIISDFFPPGALVQKALQQLMITCFRIIAGHPRSDLPDLAAFFDSKIWRLVGEKTWRKGWIRARVYGKIDESLG
jgi:SAM-dependent methyltransferase